MQNSSKQKVLKIHIKFFIVRPILLFRVDFSFFDKKRPRLAGSIISFVVKMCYLKKGDHRKYKGANRSAQINKPKMINIYKNILKNHIKLYMEDESFAANVFLATEKKLKKYKKLYLCFLISNIFLIIIICALTIFLIGVN